MKIACMAGLLVLSLGCGRALVVEAARGGQRAPPLTSYRGDGFILCVHHLDAALAEMLRADQPDIVLAFLITGGGGVERIDPERAAALISSGQVEELAE